MVHDCNFHANVDLQQPHMHEKSPQDTKNMFQWNHLTSFVSERKLSQVPAVYDRLMCPKCFWFGRAEVCRERERNKEAKNDPEETRQREDEEKQASSQAGGRPVGDWYVRTRR